MAKSGARFRSSHGPGSRLALAAALASLFALLTLVVPAGASAVAFRSCRSDAGFVCGSIRVPLDRTGRTPGSLRIAIAAQRSYAKGAGVMIALSGGPGQGSIGSAGSFQASLDPVLRHQRLVVLDQRGTGLSGALQCPAIQRLGGLEEFGSRAIADCARRIGPRRAFYRTADTVADLEDLRRALGVKKISLMGISYGTWVAQEYARTHPKQTESLILDSIVGPDASDAFALGNLERLPRVLREQCARGRCRGATKDIVGDIGKVAARLRTTPLRGRVFGADGVARTTSYTSESQFYFLVTSVDLNPFMQARLPGAVGSAARGDLAPLLRLKRLGEGPPTKTRELSFGLNVATGCLDATLPFSLASDPATRAPLVREALAAIPPASYAPWSAQMVNATSYSSDCLLWPRDDRMRQSLGGLPNVRALLLSGRLDMRTPTEDALLVKRLLPRSELVTVPGNGHDEVDTDGTGCVERALTRWAARKPVGKPCKGRTNQIDPLPRAPLKLAEFRRPAGVPGDRGRTLAAVLDTVEDARFTGLESVYAGFDPRGGGLHGGSYSATDAFSGELTLRDYSYLAGLRVSGRLRIDGERVSGRVTVRGPVSGSLLLRSTSAASGVLGGRRVAYAGGRMASAADAGAAPAFPRIPAALLDPAAVARRHARHG